MPKQCNELECQYNQFGGGFCKKHQYLRQDKKKAERRAKTPSKSQISKPRLIPISKLDALTWKFISLAYRLQDTNNEGITKCATCNTELYYFGTKKCHMSHFQKRRFGATKFLRTNQHSACSYCNSPALDGRPYEMGVFLNKKYGEGTAEEMIKLARTSFKHDRLSLKRILLDAIYLLELETNKKKLEDWKSGLLKHELQLYEDALDRRYENSEIIIGKHRIP